LRAQKPKWRIAGDRVYQDDGLDFLPCCAQPVRHLVRHQATRAVSAEKIGTIREHGAKGSDVVLCHGFNRYGAGKILDVVWR